MSDKFDVIVIGAGPAGYVAAIRCAQLGMHVACIDEWQNADGRASLGGTCLNVGCIPSKALLDSSEKVAQLEHEYEHHGISAGKVKVDVKKMVARKDGIVANLTQGIAGLFKANKVHSILGRGTLINEQTVQVQTPDGEQHTYQADNIILAVGSSPMAIPVAEVDNVNILDNEGALNIDTPPKKLGIIGGGVIGLELGSVWKRLGSEVTVFEAMDDFLAAADKQISREAQRVFSKTQGLDIKLGAMVTESTIKTTKSGKTSVAVKYTTKGESHNASFDKLIVAVGRKANTSGIADKSVGLALDERGRIEINAQFETNIKGVYAIGDAVKGPMLAHKASEEGVAVAEIIDGQKPQLNHNTIPWVIYTHPEIAWVGITEEQAKQQNIDYKTGFFPFAANGRALAMNEKNGRIKVIADAKTDCILGVHIFGPNASELIAEAVLAMEYSACTEDIARTVHAHPTLSEAFHEAALSVSSRALHKVN